MKYKAIEIADISHKCNGTASCQGNPNVKALRALVTSCTKINTAIEIPAVW